MNSRTKLKLFLVAIILVLATVLARQPEASEFKLLELQDASVHYRRYKDGGRDAVVYPETPKDGLLVNLDMDVLRYLYWNNTVGSIATENQYRAVWLNSKVGIRLTDLVSVQMNHKSTHVLDREHSYMSGFPVEDSVDLILTLRAREGKAPAVFK